MDEFTVCSACSRTPLVGEVVTVMRGERRESAVCDLCLERPRTAALGRPVRSERIRSAAGAANVRLASSTPSREPARAAA